MTNLETANFYKTLDLKMSTRQYQGVHIFRIQKFQGIVQTLKTCTPEGRVSKSVLKSVLTQYCEPILSTFYLKEHH